MTDLTNLRAEVEALPSLDMIRWPDGPVDRAAVLALIDKHSPKPAPPAFEVGQRVKVVTDVRGLLEHVGTVEKVSTHLSDGRPWALPYLVRGDERQYGWHSASSLVPYDPTAELLNLVDDALERGSFGGDIRDQFDTLLAAVIAEASRG